MCPSRFLLGVVLAACLVALRGEGVSIAAPSPPPEMSDSVWQILGMAKETWPKSPDGETRFVYDTELTLWLAPDGHFEVVWTDDPIDDVWGVGQWSMEKSTLVLAFDIEWEETWFEEHMREWYGGDFTFTCLVWEAKVKIKGQTGKWKEKNKLTYTSTAPGYDPAVLLEPGADRKRWRRRSEPARRVAMPF